MTHPHDQEGPPSCHYDRGLEQRVTRAHTDACGKGNDCPGSHGCAPCQEDHCVVCGREHATHTHPVTCPECVGKIRGDLADITRAHVDLAVEAVDGGRDGRLAAAGPIPGGLAQILAGPSVPTPAVRYSRTLLEDHPVSEKTGKPTDPMPPLAILAQWEDLYRRHLGHDTDRRATVAGACEYLTTQLPYIAQHPHTGPDWLAFTRQTRALRAQLEHALHDEREPERGVECFECGEKLVRRFHEPQPCRHATAARETSTWWLRLGYPEALTVRDVRAARRPCGDCDQGGIDDPAAGISWECPGCRKHYDPGEYANAVRRDLLEGGPDGDGWTHVSMAAEAATTMTGVTFSPARVRRWMDRCLVGSMCQWSPGSETGLRLVLWQDVKNRAAEAVVKAHMVEVERRREAAQECALRSAVDAGEDSAEAGRRLSIHPARVEKFLARWAAVERQEARRRTA